MKRSLAIALEMLEVDRALVADRRRKSRWSRGGGRGPSRSRVYN